MTRRVELSARQAQIVERVARGLPDKAIAHELGISVRTVHGHIRKTAARIPVSGPPRHRLTVLAARMGLFFFDVAPE